MLSRDDRVQPLFQGKSASQAGAYLSSNINWYLRPGPQRAHRSFRFLSDGPSNKAKILKNPGFKHARGVSHLHYFIDLGADTKVSTKHLRHSRLRPSADEGIAQLPHDSFHCAALDVCVPAVEIAQRLLETAILCLRHKPGVSSRFELLPRDAHALVRKAC